MEVGRVLWGNVDELAKDTNESVRSTSVEQLQDVGDHLEIYIIVVN